MTEQRPACQAEHDEQLTVLVPEQPPVLTPAAARALLRLLQAADHRTTDIPDSEEEQAA